MGDKYLPKHSSLRNEAKSSVSFGFAFVLLLVVESAFTCLDPTKVRDRSNAAQWPKTHGDANPQLRRTKPQAGTLPAENHVGA